MISPGSWCTIHQHTYFESLWEMEYSLGSSVEKLLASGISNHLLFTSLQFPIL